MARPKKNNAAYFSHDSSMRNDLKVKALRNKYGNNGYSIWCMLLEVLTDSENFEIKFDDLSKELLAADFNVESQLLTEVIYYAVLLKLVIIDNGVLYSENHKKRFKPLLDKRGRDRLRVQEVYEKKKEEKCISIEDFVSINEIESYLNSTEQSYWFEQFCMNNHISADELRSFIVEFVSWLQDGGFEEKNKKDLKEHFRNWFNSKKYGKYNKSRESDSRSNERKEQLIREAAEISKST